MDKETAKQILIQSVSNLQKRRGGITSEDLEAEVINNACLAIITKRKEKTSKAKDIQEMFLDILNSTKDIVPYSQSFTEAAMELFPQYYTVNEAIIATQGISTNVMWEGMWDFLRDYFQKNHGIKIDEVETVPLIFYSTKHRRYENENLVSESEVERTLNIRFIDDKDEVMVSIEPTLSPKKGYLVKREENYLQYQGYDSDYLFTIYFDSFDEVESFIMEMPGRRLKLIYLE